jgi:16S rRNA (cytosine967-C5)-methyltransferase
LANAVLRKVNQDAVEWPDRATSVSCPEWLLRRWHSAFGEAMALGIARAALEEPQHYVRIPAGSEFPNGLDLELTSVPGCYRLRSGAKEMLRFHDISSQSIIPHLALEAGHSLLDLCAAPGNKLAQALETSLGRVVACDLSEERMYSVATLCDRVVLDAIEPLPFSTKFDRILVDAPCSGTGTLAGNPEIKWRLRPADLTRFHTRQKAILTNALHVLAPAGRLVYATCSLEHEENEDVVRAVLEKFPTLTCERKVHRLPGRHEGDGFYAAVIEERV